VTTAAEPATGHRDRRDWLVAGLAAVGLLALFVAVQRGEITTYDSKIAVATAKAIAQGHLHLDSADDVYGRHLPYSHYGIGMPLVILPLSVLQQAFHAPPEVLVTLASPCCLPAQAPCSMCPVASWAGVGGCRWPGRWSSARSRWPCRSARTCSASQGSRSPRRC
jgi:hypothetical protein